MPQEIIQNKIFVIRKKKIMIDQDLAALYQVETKALNQAVKRQIKRFPADFMFQLTKAEFESWKSQIGNPIQTESNSLRSQSVTLKRGHHRKYLPYVFTEHGILMLSSVLNSDRAILVNIEIMRTFTKLREMLAGHEDLKQKIKEMEKKYDYQFKVVFAAIQKLLEPPTRNKKPIGFHAR
ncbi:MAG: ORF6N domain-containing protein [Candidatus Omnitrophica bacterium]|nr:ORF6N domain-containing protein [Candidatus Omnitrophota bacterium]